MDTWDGSTIWRMGGSNLDDPALDYDFRLVTFDEDTLAITVCKMNRLYYEGELSYLHIELTTRLTILTNSFRRSLGHRHKWTSTMFPSVHERISQKYSARSTWTSQYLFKGADSRWTDGLWIVDYRLDAGEVYGYLDGECLAAR